MRCFFPCLISVYCEIHLSFIVFFEWKVRSSLDLNQIRFSSFILVVVSIVILFSRWPFHSSYPFWTLDSSLAIHVHWCHRYVLLLLLLVRYFISSYLISDHCEIHFIISSSAFPLIFCWHWSNSVKQFSIIDLLSSINAFSIFTFLMILFYTRMHTMNANN